MTKAILREKTCCFTGHRIIAIEDIPDIKLWLEKTIVELYLSREVRFFGSGGAIGYDILAAEAVLRVSSNMFPEIKLILVLPCPGHDRFWNEDWKQRLAAVKERAAKIVYTSERYGENCMSKRNRHLVDHAGYCVAYIKKKSGGTAFTVSYAMEKGLTIVKYPEPIRVIEFRK